MVYPEWLWAFSKWIDQRVNMSPFYFIILFFCIHDRLEPRDDFPTIHFAKPMDCISEIKVLICNNNLRSLYLGWLILVHLQANFFHKRKSVAAVLKIFAANFGQKSPHSKALWTCPTCHQGAKDRGCNLLQRWRHIYLFLNVWDFPLILRTWSPLNDCQSGSGDSEKSGKYIEHFQLYINYLLYSNCGKCSHYLHITHLTKNITNIPWPHLARMTSVLRDF